MKKSIIKKAVCVSFMLCLLFIGSSLTYAAPINGTVYELKQPDGQEVKVKVYGDEFYRRMESLDGYTVVKDPKTNYICYAKLNHDGSELISTGEVYRGGTPLLRKDALKLPGKKGLMENKEAILKKIKESKQKTGYDRILSRAPLNTLNTVSENGTTSIKRESSQIRSSILLQNTPSKGTTNVVGLAILVKFKNGNPQYTYTKDQVSDLLNKEGYREFSNNYSMRDYFYHFSEGKLNYTNIVTEYYTTKYEQSYYENDKELSGSTLLIEALNDLKSKGFDFSRLSRDSNGIVWAVNLLYAGVPLHGAEKVGLYPHADFLLQKLEIGDNIYVDGFQVSEIDSHVDFLYPGIIIHENGHMLMGWPDTYDLGIQSGDFKSYGTGTFDVMGGGTMRDPQPPNPYFRCVLARWGTLYNLDDIKNGEILVQPNQISAYVKYNPKNPKECFLIENIKNDGSTIGSKNMPGSGLLIWHIDGTKSNNDEEQMTPSQHYMVSVEQADGLYQLEKGIPSGNLQDDFFNEGYKTEFNKDTTPNSRWWDGSDSGFRITGIRKSGDNLIFNRATDWDANSSVNLALSATAAASSEYSTSYSASKTKDGDAVNTRWNTASGRDVGEWLEMNFGSPVSFNRVVLKEYLDRISSYTIQYYDGSRWIDLIGGATVGASKTDRFRTVAAQKIRIYITGVKRDSYGWGTEPTLYEFEVYCDNNLAPGAIARASTEYSSSYSASMTNDTNGGTRWNAAPGRGAGEWLQLDFGVQRSFNNVVVKEYLDRINGFKIQYYNGSSWVDLYSGTGVGPTFSTVFNTVVAQKIRIYITGVKRDSNGWGTEPTIHEFEVYCTENQCLGGIAGASSDAGNTYSASKANDAYPWISRWSAASGRGAGEWLEIQFPKKNIVNKVIIKEYLDRITGYKLQYYNGSSWVDLSTGTSVGPAKIITFSDMFIDRIRLYITGTKIDSYGLGSEPSIYEMEAYFR